MPSRRSAATGTQVKSCGMPPRSISGVSGLPGGLLSESVLFMKFGGSIGGFFIAVVLPAVWYFSKLDTNVDTLKSDVRDVKTRTEGLERSAIRHDERIGQLEKGLINTKTDTTRNVQKK